MGKKFGSASKGGEVYLLTGDLGGGKTQFTKGLAKGLGIEEWITSPTFIYENIYEGKKLKMYHFDLYRSDVIDEDIKDLMLEAFSDQGGITVVEWADRAKEYWPKKFIHLNFEWLGEEKREISEAKSGKRHE